MTGAVNPFLTPIVQYGFAGFCAVLIGIIVWLISKLLDVLRQTNETIAKNTDAVNRQIEAQKQDRTLAEQHMTLLRSINDKLLSRPCIAEKGKF